jgi:hypothetical protein
MHGPARGPWTNLGRLPLRVFSIRVGKYAFQKRSRSQLTANSDPTHFVTEVNQHREKKVIVEGRGYCKGSRSRCPRFKCKVFYKTNTGHTSKTNWRISNLKPRVPMDSCRKDHSCKCDNSDTALARMLINSRCIASQIIKKNSELQRSRKSMIPYRSV